MGKQLSSSAHRRSEVIVISGFLGAGKTTLLKKILSWESDLSETVVIVIRIWREMINMDQVSSIWKRNAGKTNFIGLGEVKPAKD